MSVRRADLSSVLGALPPGNGLAGDLGDERALALAFQRGEDGAYQAIYDRYSARVHGVCRRMLGHHDDAQEAAQETFLRVYQALARFNGRYQLGAWITRIATNVCLDQIRARSRRPEDAAPLDLTQLESESFGGDDPAELTLRRHDGRRVRRLLASLPPMHRAAIVLRDFEGLSYEEIGIALGLTDCQVKALLHRARKAFKRSWASTALSILMPWRGIQRLREVETSVRDGATQVVTSSSPMLTSCSAVLQQCGQFVAERAAPVVTAALVGGAAAAAAAGGLADHPTVDRPAAVAAAPAPDTHNHIRDGRALRKPAPSHTAGAPLVSDVEDPVPTPVETPEPEPSPSPEPGDPAEEEDPVGGEVQPATPSEPTWLTVAFSTDLAPSGPACSCVGPTNVVSESVTLDETGLDSFTQTITGSAEANGSSVYGLRLDHGSTDSWTHKMTFQLLSTEGSFVYSALGVRSVEAEQTEWGGWVYRFTGEYHLTGAPTRDATMPHEGTYVATVVTSWRQHRVVSVNVALDDEAN